LLSEHIFAQEKGEFLEETDDGEENRSSSSSSERLSEDAEQHNKSATRVLVPVANANHQCRPVISLSY
jgi:hypothetical protein